MLSGGLLLFVLFSWVIPQLPRWLVVNEMSSPSDVIVVLNGQNIKERIEHGVSLYKQGYAPRLLLSGMSELEQETGIYLRKIYAVSLGVPESAIDVEGFSRSTYEDALHVKKYLEERPYRSFILVTSPTHTFRSRFYFKKIIPSSIRWSVSCDPKQVHFDKWWQNVATAREVFYEYLSLPYCFLRQQ